MDLECHWLFLKDASLSIFVKKANLLLNGYLHYFQKRINRLF